MGLENVSQSVNGLLSFIGTVCVNDSTSVVERLRCVSTLMWLTVRCLRQNMSRSTVHRVRNPCLQY
jgi:hypothetical protein